MRYCAATFLIIQLWCASAVAVEPLNAMQLRNVCQAFMAEKMSVEGQICGYYILGFLDGSAIANAEFCVEDVPLLQVMRSLAAELDRTHPLMSHSEMPARDILLPILKFKYPCGN